jgi:hypothetical protein
MMARKSLEWNEEREFDLAKYECYQSQPKCNDDTYVGTEDFDDENEMINDDGKLFVGMRASRCSRLSSKSERRAFLENMLPSIEAQFASVVSGEDVVPQPWRGRRLKGIIEGRALDIKKYDDETSTESEGEVCCEIPLQFCFFFLLFFVYNNATDIDSH